MDRLDFASVMMVLRRNILDGKMTNQIEFVGTLFEDVNDCPEYAVEYDAGQVCQWINGLAKVSPSIISFYQENKNQRKLVERIKENLLPIMPDSAMAVQELYDLVLQAPNVSPFKKKELTDGYTIEDDNDEAIFIAEVLCLAMQLRYEKRDVRKKQLMIPGSRSPAVADYISGADAPRPCRWFLGREQEMKVLHNLFMDHSKVFLQGIPGIGKSEIAKAYAEHYGKEYTNVIYIQYPGDLRRAVIELNFIDDLPCETDENRFARHARFLSSLKEDTLLIVDNMNVTAYQDQYLDEVLQYSCRILFTTRNRYDNYVSLEVSEMSADLLQELMQKFCPADEKKRNVAKEIIDLLHRHTFATELAARLLAKGLLTPKMLLKKLKKEKAALDAEDKIGTTKDGRNKQATYYNHIHSLFGLYKLSDKEKDILRSLTLMPRRGIPSRCFAAWMKQNNMNTINDLIDAGFVYPQNDSEILLHPMIQEVAVEELVPSVRNCAVLLDSLQEVSLMHGLDFVNNRQVYHVAENIMETVQKDDIARYMRFLEDVYQYMDKYQYESGMQKIIGELTAMLEDNTVGSAADRACLLDCRAALEKNAQKQVELVKQAIQVLGEVHSETAHLAANLHGNLGALYHRIGHTDLAKLHMEQGIYLLKEYDLTGYHDSVTQMCNYAVLITDQGEPQMAYTELLKLSKKVKELNSDQCLDFGNIQQLMGSISIIKGDIPQAQQHLRQAMAIFEVVYEDEPALLEEKRQEIGQLVLAGYQQNQRLIG